MQAKVNTEWFRAQLAEREMSMRGLAKKMELDPASVSLMLRGMRRMTTAEANKIANLLNVPVTEVLRQAGVPVTQDAHTAALTGLIDSASTIKKIDNKVRHQTPPDVPTDGFVLQVRSASSPTDGWLVYCSPAIAHPAAALERFCVVTLADGETVIGTIRKGYEDSTYNIITTFPNQSVLENKKVTTVSTVLWIRPR